jgi:putative transposase
MARARRNVAAGESLHVYNRGNNRTTIFQEDIDRETFLVLVERSTERKGVAVHALALMTTHFHLLVTPRAEHALSLAMKQIGERYSRYYNGKYGRTGTLWERRYQAVQMNDDAHSLICLRYIEQNPVRAGLVSHPEAYRWSSYAVHALGHRSDWLVPHTAYLALGHTDEERQAAYQAICAEPLPARDIARLRHG